ncbi:uncharacterized protein LOC113066354 [Carassius auratus]|uniref:Uncharacterized protein LOC113066354 n=1 Tax=Carassius auratus TaxID=7957 RepID=A0A6P6MDQ2_CARAU|nr:uncharacterized protein LOC113066354 [Carassius auratus]
MMERLLLMFVLTHASGTQYIQTVSKICVQKQQTITVPCLYDQKYANHPKYMSCGGVWIFSHSVTHSRMSVEDDPAVKVFKATLREAEVSDSGWYWCAVSMSGSDPHKYLYLQVTEAEPGLRVSSQTVSGYEGGNVTILCHGASHWCTIRGSCAGRDAGSLERTVVRDDDGSVLRVTLYQLQKEDSGWYYCANKDSQMPVHLTVHLTITQCTTNPSYSSTPPSTDRQFLWLLLLGAMLLITVCAAVMLIRARNTRKQSASAESSNLHEGMDKQQLPTETGKNSEAACENLYEIMTGIKQNTQGNRKNKEVACENLYETMTGIKQNNQLTAIDNKNIYASMVRKVKK